jgi:hypothetical protein
MPEHWPHQSSNQKFYLYPFTQATLVQRNFCNDKSFPGNDRRMALFFSLQPSFLRLYAFNPVFCGSG